MGSRATQAGAQVVTLPPGKLTPPSPPPCAVGWGHCDTGELHVQSTAYVESAQLKKCQLQGGLTQLPSPTGILETLRDTEGWTRVTRALPTPDKLPILFQLDRGCKVAALRIQRKSKGLGPGYSSRVCNMVSGAEGSSHPELELMCLPRL